MVERDLALALDVDMSLEELEDNDLLQMTRRGSSEAYAVLYDRYVYSARRLARHLGQREESDDVVSDAFAQILGLLQRGKGPDRAFRAYLFTTIRHESGRRAKANKRVMPTDDDSQIDSAVPFGDGNLDDFEKTAIRAAYESLPDRWRTVLWHLDVEGRKPNELADVMGLKANSVSALVYRARAGLRDAYLQQHLSTAGEPLERACGSVRGHLAAVVRRTATKRDQEKVHAHLESCEACMAAYLDLQEVNREVGAIVAPAALAAAIGGGSLLAAAGSGGIVVTHVVAAVKGLLAAAAAPAAAAAVTGVAVISVTSSGPAPSTQAATVAEPSRVQPAPSAVEDQPSADRGSSTPAPRTGAADALPTAQQATKRVTPSAAAPSTPATAAPDVDAGPAKVVLAPDAVEVAVGPVEVSTRPVKDLLDAVAPKTSKVLSDVVRGAAQ